MKTPEQIVFNWIVEAGFIPDLAIEQAVEDLNFIVCFTDEVDTIEEIEITSALAMLRGMVNASRN